MTLSYRLWFGSGPALTNSGHLGKNVVSSAAPAETEKPNQVNLYVAQSFPRWKEIVIDLLRAHYDEKTSSVSKEVMPLLNKLLRDPAERLRSWYRQLLPTVGQL